MIIAVHPASAQSLQESEPSALQRPAQLVWIDTDIGDDIDDAFALALLLKSPEVRILGISTTFGDTETRARLVDRFLDRFLAGAGAPSIPVTAGLPTKTANVLTQRAYAEGFPARPHPDAVAALLAAIQAHPGQVTLLAIGPLFNVAAASQRSPETFHKLKRIVMMGGSIRRGYNSPCGKPTPPSPEWNILQDPPGAQQVFATGVPVFLLPLDSTQIPLSLAARLKLFAAANPLTDQLALLYPEWTAHSWNHSPTPILYDALAAASILKPRLCPTRPMRIAVNDQGFTLTTAGPPNAQVCLQSDATGFSRLMTERIEKK
uniref:Putative inosine-uridine preferring nucleoside hydrolase n=1 Tax=mine drainage metagenome TaxID=410659 RepID=E6PYA3_9ZZZZ